MTELAKAARRAYKRQWTKDHPDKVKEYQERYFIKKAKELGIIPDDDDNGNSTFNGKANNE